MCSHDTVFRATIQLMEILTLTEAGIPKAAEKAARILQKGGVVLFPTDTVYGLAADATNPKALATLRAIKGREAKKPISVVVPGIESISTYAVMDDASRSLAERFLPGALTLVLKATPSIPAELTLAGKVGSVSRTTRSVSRSRTRSASRTRRRPRTGAGGRPQRRCATRSFSSVIMRMTSRWSSTRDRMTGKSHRPS